MLIVCISFLSFNPSRNSSFPFVCFKKIDGMTEMGKETPSTKFLQLKKSFDEQYPRWRENLVKKEGEEEPTQPTIAAERLSTIAHLPIHERREIVRLWLITATGILPQNMRPNSIKHFRDIFAEMKKLSRGSCS